MSQNTYTDEEVLDHVIEALLKRPQSNVDLYGEFDYNIGQDLIDEALDVLEDLNVLKVFREARQGSRVNVYAIKSECRTYIECSMCKGSGVQDDVKRGLCQFCKGDGLVTPHGAFESSANGRSV